MKEIPLSTRRLRRNSFPRGKVALVDDEDYDLAMQYPWHAIPLGTTWYAKSGATFLHRLVMGFKHGDGRMVDHKDRDGLNCQKRNLRPAVDSQNKANVPPRGKSGIKGVRFYKGAWEANIKHQYLGRFPTAKAAADAYDQAAIRTHGEFAWLNNLES